MNTWDAFRGHDPNIRASDADRERIADRLRAHHTDGRIDSDELNDRIDACYRAKTIGELDQLLHDLPRELHSGDRPPLLFGRRLPWMPRLWPIVIALIVISAVTGAHLIWLLIPLFFAIRFGLLGRYGCSLRRRRGIGGSWA